MSLQIRNSPSQIPSSHEMMVYSTMAKQAVASKMYKGIGDENGVMMIILAAREMGLPAMACLNGGLNIINGKVEISARMMSGMIRRAGHSITIERSDDEICILSGRRNDNGDTAKASFSIDDAKRAKIWKAEGGWGKWPKDMCFARALSRLGRQLFSDVIGIGYVEGELQDKNQKPHYDGVLTEENVGEEFEIDVEETTQIEIYLQMFQPDDRHLALEYLKIVSTHYKWDQLQTIQELTKDKLVLMEKFHAWKEKTKIAANNGKQPEKST